ncbi:hypothetical protein [Peptostreptococcus equinus]|uniref:Phage capsid family protein n=1 Tax=Peptostreptococcus equinus TaxID=3003601 RepID=A0ABY7JPI5_9FIRM|nr:hypothetical protein [Peptostreptococcus sp. CBA3647]WAW15283.1 hypothetical protein O0R46_02190 [Peptostreptococcus sp. CBA3647]
MAVEEKLSRTFIRPQEIDFVEVFGKELKNLTRMLGIERKMPLPMGSIIRTYTSQVTLDGTVVEPGDIIPLSEVKMVEGPKQELVWDKKRKAVPVEDIQKYGFQQSIITTDNKLMRELQKELKKKLFAQLATGKTEVTGAGFQESMAKGWGALAEKFEDDDITSIAFVNPLDVSDYLAKANISTQTTFGLKYVENFLNVSVAIISASVPKGTIYMTASQNLVLAYATMGSGEIDKAFDLTTDSTGIIGIGHDVNMQRLTAETITVSAMLLFAERVDGIVKATITPGV